MQQELKRIFRKLTPLEVASRELVEAELGKLEAETALEWAKATVEFNTSRIARLRRFLFTHTDL